MEPIITQKKSKNKRKDFRASDEELLQLAAHCSKQNISHSDFIRVAIQEKIARDTTPTYTYRTLADNHFYNYIVRESITNPALRKIINNYQGSPHYE